MKLIRHILLLCILLLSNISLSQTDGFFRTQEDYSDRARTETTTMTPENFGTPIDTGLGIMFCLGIAYGACRSKRFRKYLKVGMLILPIALFSCTKENQHYYEELQQKSLTFVPMQTRTEIDPTGQVTWSQSDVIHVYSNTVGYLGKLTNQDNTFSGKIDQWAEGDSLILYYLGQNTPSKGKELTIDYSMQTVGTLQDIADHYHVSRCVFADVQSDANNLSGQMLNQMAIVKFDLQQFITGNVKILASENLNNCISISKYGRLSYSVVGINPATDIVSGEITTAAGNRYLAMLPKSSDTPAALHLQALSNSKQSDYIDITIHRNDFLTVQTTASDYIDSRYSDYTIVNDETKKFTINADSSDYKKIVFAPGNLVYVGGRFKQHSDPTSIAPFTDQRGCVTGTYDRFGWVTGGIGYSNYLYQPYTISDATDATYTSANGYGYGPKGSNGYNQSCYPGVNGTLEYRKCDWGWAQFRMDLYPQTQDGRYWRTLGTLEWEYMFYASKPNRSLNNDHTTPLYGYATVDGTRGVILLPDLWTDNIFQSAGINFTYGAKRFSTNVLSATDWTAIEQYGAVFLPVDGYRIGNVITNQDKGYYWDCKHAKTESAYALVIREDKTPKVESLPRYTGCFVRLVYQTDGPIW